MARQQGRRSWRVVLRESRSLLAGMMRADRDSKPECRREAFEDERRVEDDGLAVQSDVHRRSGVDPKSRCYPLPQIVKRGSSMNDDYTEGALIHSTSCALASDGVELVAVVRDKKELDTGKVLAIRPGEPEVERFSARTEQLGRLLDHRSQFGVPIFLGLHDCSIQSHGRIVDEDAVVDASEVDAALLSIEECIERTDEVIPVEADVEGEVIPRAGRYTHEREIVRGCNRRHHSL